MKNGKLFLSKTKYGQEKVIGDFKYDVRYIPFEGTYNKLRIAKALGKVYKNGKLRFDKYSDGLIRLEIVTLRKGK